MMMSADDYIKRFEFKNYYDLIKERDKLTRSIRRFEKNPPEEYEYYISPSPDVVYQMNLLYLAKVCELISHEYRDRPLMPCPEIK